MPGLTGLPSVPRKATSMAWSLSSASSPPTTYRRGHANWYSTAALGTRSPGGKTTHGPATGTQTMKPLHSLVAPAGPGRASCRPPEPQCRERGSQEQKGRGGAREEVGDLSRRLLVSEPATQPLVDLA